MSFLTPLYLLGALAIVGPIVFHLIRKTPRGQVMFSSLMFLSPTPPRLTRRSRIDDVLLLLLRVLALGLLAAAFARPFLREAASLNLADAERRRVTLLVDTSASMRRGDLATRARELARAAVDACRPGDQLAVYAFDSAPRALLTFAESATLDPTRRRAVALSRLDTLAPTWGATDLGRALVDAVAATEDVADASEKLGRIPRRIVLVTDLQQGSKLDALGDFEWPRDVELELKLVRADGANAGLQGVPDQLDAGPDAPDQPLRVRVTNEPGAPRETFRLTWVDAKGGDIGKPIDAYVPPGEGRVVTVPRPPAATPAAGLRLDGDPYPFDNRLYLAAGRKQEATVLFVGDDPADDPNGLLYYLERAFEDSPARSVRVVARSPKDVLSLDPAPSKDEKAVERSVPLIIVAGETSPANQGKVRDYLIRGGTVVCILKPGPHPLAAITDGPRTEAPEATGRDAMLGEVAFDHPLFAPFAGAQFNDFTKIRFWKHRRVDLETIPRGRVLARFEGGDPAIHEQRIGKGSLIVFASGWAPGDSQLARSSKFVPLMANLLDLADPTKASEAPALLVGDRVPLPATSDSPGRSVRKPDGTLVACEPGVTHFAGTSEPGVYAIEAGGISRPFAVNLDPLESRTSPLGVETLEQLGCRMATGEGRERLDRERLRQMQTVELEGRQKLWRWLILATIGILIVETWLAGRLRARSPSPTAPTSEPPAR